MAALRPDRQVQPGYQKTGQGQNPGHNIADEPQVEADFVLHGPLPSKASILAWSNLSKEREDRRVQGLDGQAGGNAAAAQEIEQAKENQTDGQDGAKDQEKHFHLPPHPCQAWSSS